MCGRGSAVACVKSCMKTPDRKKNLFPNHQRLRIPLLPFSDVCSAYGTKEADLISSVNAYHLLPLKKKKWTKSKAGKLSCLLPPFAPHVAHAKSITNKSKWCLLALPGNMANIAILPHHQTCVGGSDKSLLLNCWIELYWRKPWLSTGNEKANKQQLFVSHVRDYLTG